MSVGFRGVLGCMVAVLAVGCGGAKLDREGAARMALGAGHAGTQADSKGGLLSLHGSGASGGALGEASCSRGGNVSWDLAGLAFEGGLDVTFDLGFNGCTEPLWDDPETAQIEQEEVTQDGEVAMTLGLRAGEDFLTYGLTLEGELDYTGAVRDEVKMDVTQTLRLEPGKLLMTLDGSIQSSTETHTYDNELWILDQATGEFVRKDGV